MCVSVFVGHAHIGEVWVSRRREMRVRVERRPMVTRLYKTKKTSQHTDTSHRQYRGATVLRGRGLVIGRRRLICIAGDCLCGQGLGFIR